jgi:hypothetical protein
MNDQRLEFSEAEFERRVIERHVDYLFDAAASLPGADHFLTTPFLPTPYLGDPGFFAGFEPPETRQRVVCALAAAWQFYQEYGPDYGVLLPLHQKDCELLQNADDVRLNLVGYYGLSQLYACWDEQHPNFRIFNCGLMANDQTPAEIRNDVGLQREFPPHPLVGFDGLHWRSPESWAEVRWVQAAEAVRAKANCRRKTTSVETMVRATQFALARSSAKTRPATRSTSPIM